MIGWGAGLSAIASWINPMAAFFGLALMEPEAISDLRELILSGEGNLSIQFAFYSGASLQAGPSSAEALT